MDTPSSSQARILKAAQRLFAQRGSGQISISELAQEAGVARGTVYNNLSSPETLLEDVAAQLATEMNRRVGLSFAGMDSSAARLAQGIRLYIRRAHDEPDWGRFLCRFSFSSDSLRELWTGNPAIDLLSGIRSGEFALQEGQVPTTLASIAGAVLAAMMLVLEGYKTWREAGSDAAEFVLKALGVPAVAAAALAKAPLPALPEVEPAAP